MELEERFWSKVEFDAHDEDRCWPWKAYLRADGYGRSSIGGSTVYAHRLAYELERGPIPPSLQIDHLCRNRACCNPWHLEPVTAQQNTLRNSGPTALNARKTSCPYGHPYDGSYRDNRLGVVRRRCKQCTRDASARVRAKRTQEGTA